MSQLILCNRDSCIHNTSGIACKCSQVNMEEESFIDCLTSKIVQCSVCKNYKGKESDGTD